MILTFCHACTNKLSTILVQSILCTCLQVFNQMEPGARPLKVPFFTPAAPSPLPCNCTPLAKLVHAWSACYTGASSTMPADTTSWRSSSSTTTDSSTSSSNNSTANGSATASTAAAASTTGSSKASTTTTNGSSTSTDAATASKAKPALTSSTATAAHSVPDDVWSSTTSVGLEVRARLHNCIISPYARLCSLKLVSIQAHSSCQYKLTFVHGIACCSGSAYRPTQLLHHTHSQHQVSEPWAALLLSGAKPVETRSYPLPAALLNRKLAVIQSSSAAAPATAAATAAAAVASSVSDTVAAGAANLSRTGTVTFTSCRRYASEAEWAADEARHLVKSDSPFGWKAVAQRAAAAATASNSKTSNSSSGGSSAEIWAWSVGNRKTHKKARPVPHMQRVFRSLFALHYDSADATDGAAETEAPAAAAVVSIPSTSVACSGSTSGSAAKQQARHSSDGKRSRDSTADAGTSKNGSHSKSKRRKNK
jgi:hypothetical protein